MAKEIVKREGTAGAIGYFDRNQKGLTSYGYWHMLGTLWVSYTGWSEIDRWKRLFGSSRMNRETSLMKPSELEVFRSLPGSVRVFRAHRPGETDWIAYTLSPTVAARFARERGVDEVVIYEVAKTDIIAVFTRRAEYEVIVLDRTKAIRFAAAQVVVREGVDV